MQHIILKGKKSQYKYYQKDLVKDSVYGDIYKAEEIENKRQVGIKILSLSSLSQVNQIQTLMEKTFYCSQIIHILDVIEPNNNQQKQLIIILEFTTGRFLQYWVNRKEFSNDTLKIQLCSQIRCNLMLQESYFFESSKIRFLFQFRCFSKALKNYDLAIKLNPKDADYYNNKGVLLYSLGRLDEAIICYENTIQIDPQNSNYHSNKGIFYTDWDAMKKLQSATTNYHNNKGFLEFIGEFEDALKVLQMPQVSVPTMTAIKITKE